jgi:hypothetical protein
MGRIIESIFVQNQGFAQGAEFEQPVPFGGSAKASGTE